MPHRCCIAIERNALSSTVLPTPRSPVSTKLVGPATGDALEHHFEFGDLAVAASQLGRPLAGARSIRIAYGVHAIGAYGLI